MEGSRSKAVTSLLRRSNLLLIIFGCASFAIYLISLRAHTSEDIRWFLKLVLIQILLYAAVAWLIVRARSTRSRFVIVIVFAALFRFSLLFAPPFLSDDIYRYVWDGRVQAAGINPYRHIPADPALADLRDDKIYPRINRRDYAPTMYPPVAQFIYFLTTRINESVTWMKATMLLFEAVTIWALLQLLTSFGLPRERVLIYAWHPLIVWEFAGSGHVDAIAIAFVCLALLARRRDAEIGTGLALASATLSKMFPIAMLPALQKRGSWKIPIAFVITIVIAYSPYLGVGPWGVLGFLPSYAGERGILSGEHFFILSAVRRILAFNVPTFSYVVFGFVVLVALAVWMWRTGSHEDFVKNALIMASAFMVLLAPHFPWYFTWLVPFLCIIPSLPIIYLTLASFLLYLTWIYYTDDQVFKIKAVMFIPFFFLTAIALWRRRSQFKIKLASTMKEVPFLKTHG
jgi:alpha-1,6-mannosyltransferase